MMNQIHEIQIFFTKALSKWDFVLFGHFPGGILSNETLSSGISSVPRMTEPGWGIHLTTTFRKKKNVQLDGLYRAIYK
jgi:hypothetical protein